jgi:hypothetical protein
MYRGYRQSLHATGIEGAAKTAAKSDRCLFKVIRRRIRIVTVNLTAGLTHHMSSALSL